MKQVSYLISSTSIAVFSKMIKKSVNSFYSFGDTQSVKTTSSTNQLAVESNGVGVCVCRLSVSFSHRGIACIIHTHSCFGVGTWLYIAHVSELNGDIFRYDNEQ